MQSGAVACNNLASYFDPGFLADCSRGVGVEKCHWSGLWRGGELCCPDWQSGKGECGGLLAASGCYWLLSHSLREVCDFWHSGVQE